VSEWLICQGLGVSGAWCQRGVGDQQGCCIGNQQLVSYSTQHHNTSTGFAHNIRMRCTLWCLDVQQEGNKQTALAPSAPSLFATKRNWHVLLFDTNIDTLMSTRWAGGGYLNATVHSIKFWCYGSFKMGVPRGASDFYCAKTQHAI